MNGRTGGGLGEDLDGSNTNQPYPAYRYYERRQCERRLRSDRRGPLRWDPKAKERQRRGGEDRRRLG